MNQEFKVGDEVILLRSCGTHSDPEMVDRCDKAFIERYDVSPNGCLCVVTRAEPKALVITVLPLAIGRYGYIGWLVIKSQIRHNSDGCMNRTWTTMPTRSF